MPMPNLFKKFSSKGSSLETRPAADVSPNDKENNANAIVEPSEGAFPAYSDTLKEAWAAAYKELPQAHGAEKVLDKIANVQEALTLSPEHQEVVETFMATSQIAETIHKGVESFMEAVPPLMKALDEVAKIHPFISVAVLAFKAVYTLEKKRRENDKRVLALYLEMKDMMAVLLHLNDVTDTKKIAPDGQTMEGRMQNLCEDVAEDIKKCANACDAYLKKKLLVKVFAGPIWEGKLLKFVGVFTERRDQFEFELTLHTAVGVDVVNLKLNIVDQRTAEVSQKMDLMLQLFQEFLTPQQKELKEKVKDMGGVAALDDEKAMQELAGAEFDLADFVELQQEIKGDVDQAIEKNDKFFSRMFNIQRREIQDLALMVHREGDRVISAMTAGPHDRIVDPDIYNIWKDMGWRGSVKARHFIMALKDYYVEKNSKGSGSVTGPDSWALKYINIGRVPKILEAFDDDASGFITTNEVNTFTQSRPLGWSLPHWLAYWAIGWQMTCTAYCEKIEEILDAMIRSAYEVLPENQEAVRLYTEGVWKTVTTFVQPFNRDNGPEDLIPKFESYVTAEEKRLRRNFEEMKYRIDDVGTFQVIAGEGRVEMTLLPMFYLALNRGLEKISLARKHVLSKHELPQDSTIQSIALAADCRMRSLKSTFEQHNLSAEDQFKIFAEGLYIWCSVDSFEFGQDQFKELMGPYPCRDEIIPDPDTISLSVLNYPPGKRHEINFAAYDLPEFTLSPTEGAHPGLGVYYGFIYCDGRPRDPMFKFTLGKGADESTFVASGEHYRNGYYKKWNIKGNWASPSEDGKIPVDFKFIYDKEWHTLELTGSFDPEENSLRGTWPYLWEPGEFVFKRDPDFVRFYPAPSVTDARKRWEFGLKSVLCRIRRQAWSSKQIFQKIRDGRRFKELTSRQNYGRKLNDDELAEYVALLPGLCEADVGFYASLITADMHKSTIFSLEDCVLCHSYPEGSKFVCVDCCALDIILCSEPECRDRTFPVENGAKQHFPNHGMLKVRRNIFLRDLAKIWRSAKTALDCERGKTPPAVGQPILEPDCTHCMTEVSPPYWLCLECPGLCNFLCDNCEHKNLAFDETHTEIHTMLRISEGKKERSMEERLQFLEDRLAKIEEERLEPLGDRLSRIEEILAKLAEKSADGSQSKLLTGGGPRAAANV